MRLRILIVIAIAIVAVAGGVQAYQLRSLRHLEAREVDPNPVKARPLLHVVHTSQQPVPFKRVVLDARTFPNGRKPKVIIDPDGRGAVVGAQVGPDGFALYRPGKPPAIISRATRGAGDEDAQTADMNGDGAPDIVIGGLDGVTTVLLNPLHDGCRDVYRCTWPAEIVGKKHPSHDVVVGDVNHDGRPDIVTESGVYFQLRSGWQFVGRDRIPRDGEGTELAQLTHDGIPDIIAPYERGTKLARFINPLHAGGNPIRDPWRVQIIDANPPFRGNMTTAIGDLTGNGRNDIVAAPMYGGGGLVWYEAPPNPDGTWVRHTIDPTINNVHQNSLQLADVNHDGRLDIVFAEQDQSPTRRIGVYYHHDGERAWRLQVLSTAGGHNIKVGRSGLDGPLIIVSARHGAFGGKNPLIEWRDLERDGSG